MCIRDRYRGSINFPYEPVSIDLSEEKTTTNPNKNQDGGGVSSIIKIGIFVSLVTLVVVFLYYKYKRNKLRQKIIREMESPGMEVYQEVQDTERYTAMKQGETESHTQEHNHEKLLIRQENEQTLIEIAQCIYCISHLKRIIREQQREFDQRPIQRASEICCLSTVVFNLLLNHTVSGA
eukprot:TRINITY_DN4203_c0_g1_i4.p1 TRINITY_DN4203_c0_g1~~TRINITY_DN4203_c0_g1_i4.p1  ORF type:complete len:179 (+),score=12.63 TRINITY_DN4203_c0_g1_i4:80-616(+)